MWYFLKEVGKDKSTTSIFMNETPDKHTTIYNFRATHQNLLDGPWKINCKLRLEKLYPTLRNQ